MRTILALFLLVATPALAQTVDIQPDSIKLAEGSIVVTMALISRQDAKLILTSASLTDHAGRSFALSQAVGIDFAIRDACKIGMVFTANTRTTIILRFEGQGSPPFDLSAQFQTPDRSEMFGCRTFGLSLAGLTPPP
ncbi:MAG TPA: hypothetical protein VMF32_10165 [Xanthobacteraceae bacterium]|nr:hypothetical protein [Xanthobacteraceae bacterium]